MSLDKFSLFSPVSAERGAPLRSVLCAAVAAAVLLAQPASAQGAITFVQVASSVPQSPQSSVTATYAAAQTTGGLNVVAIGWTDTTVNLLTVTDTMGNAYLLAVGPTLSSASRAQAIYYAQNIKTAAAGANAVTVTFDKAATYPDLRIAEYKGIATTNALDVAVGASGTSASSGSGSVTTTNANDLLVGANYVKTVTNGPGTNYTKRVITSPDADILEDRIVTAVGSYSATAPVSPSENWVMQMAAFRAASGGVATAPAITSLNPTSGPVGTSVTINGANFGSTKGTSTVTFNGTVATPSSWSATTIVAPVPSGASTGPVVVTVAGVATAGTTFTVTGPTPTITNLSPASGAVGASVTITGTNFGAAQGGSTVKFNGTTAAPSAWGATTIVAQVPGGATTGPVVVTVGGIASAGTAFTVTTPPPTITTLNPTSGSVGAAVTITGANFGASQGASTIKFNGVSATPSSWSASTIVAPVPSGATSGNVVATVGGVASNGVAFTVNPPTNQAPSANAGPDQSITLPTNSVSLNGTASDDGLPAPPGALTYGWSVVSGPAAVAFSAPAALATTATFTTAGVYTLRLTVGDSALTKTDDTVVTVNTASSFAPILINAGGPAYTSSTGQAWAADKSFAGGNTYTSNAAIAGTADAALYKSERWGTFSYNIPVPSGTYSVTLHFAEIYWTSAGKRVFNVAIEGQSALQSFDIWALAGANTALTRTFTTAVTDGTLNIAFTGVVDNAKVSAIQVAAINAVNQAPVVNAGADRTTALPSATVALSATATDDGLPAPPSTMTYAWSVVSGPASVVFSAPTATATNATFSTAGVYTLRLTANDSALAGTDDLVVTVSPPDTELPSVPTNLDGSAVSTTRVNLTWTASSDNIGVSGYRIYRNGGLIGSSPTNAYADTGATADTAYSYAVLAYDAAGNSSALSTPVNVNTPSTPPGPVYPVKMSANHRYLVDQNDVPFLMTGDAPHSMIVNLSLAQADAYLADRAAHGFNALWVFVLAESGEGGRPDGSTYDGIVPFTTPGHFDTPNEAYFARMDAMVQLAANHGITLMLDLVDTGDNRPWIGFLKNNGTAVARGFGQYIGNRYKNFDNIIWISGNDFQTWQTAADDNVIRAVAQGVQDVDTRHLQTLELNYTVSGSLDDATWSSILGLDAAYTYFPTYAQVLKEYNRATIPVFMIEAHYELESVAGEYGSPRVLRAQEYWTMLSGATGHMYGNSYIWPFKAGWQQNLDTPGVDQIGYVNALLQPLRWYDLVPDQTHAIVTAGYGTFNSTTGGINGTNNYVTAAGTADGALVIAYIPGGQTITVNMAKMAGPTTARWYDPSSGTFVAIAGSPIANAGSHQFTPPGPTSDGFNDWVLVLQTTP